MSEMSELKFGTWAPPESIVAVEYSLAALEEIRKAVAEGFQRFARGGIEVGGVLYGNVDGSTTRILAVREISCEHLTGPSFQLSEKDRAALTEQLESDRTDPRLDGLQPLGFYVSHTRSEIALLPGEFEIFNARFPEPQHLVMVVRPGRAGRMRAGFFVREADGSIKADRSHLDFDFPDRIIGAPASPSSAEKRRRDSVPPPAETPARSELAGVSESFETASGANPVLPATERSAFELPTVEMEEPLRAPEYIPVPQPKKKWLAWTLSIAGVLIAAVAAIVGLRYFGHLAASPISLNVTDAKSQLTIGWDAMSPTIQTAAQGTIQIVEGNNTFTAKLGPGDLAKGSYSYPRRTGDVQIQMDVETTANEKRTEMTRFLGAPPQSLANDEVEALRKERDSMREELDRLRERNTKLAAELKQSERSLTVLRTRIGIVSPGNTATGTTAKK